MMMMMMMKKKKKNKKKNKGTNKCKVCHVVGCYRVTAYQEMNSNSNTGIVKESQSAWLEEFLSWLENLYNLFQMKIIELPKTNPPKKQEVENKNPMEEGT
ncbi:hypothetical protein M0804_012642 [Polistes exclamans]|nr:hypothetical protein M0804_012642 [Polistes exclamans]